MFFGITVVATTITGLSRKGVFACGQIVDVLVAVEGTAEHFADTFCGVADEPLPTTHVVVEVFHVMTAYVNIATGVSGSGNSCSTEHERTAFEVIFKHENLFKVSNK